MSNMYKQTGVIMRMFSPLKNKRRIMMKTRTLKKALSLFLSLVMMLSLLPTMALATEEKVSTYDALKTALEAGGSVKLAGNITATPSLAITVTQDTELDLNGYAVSITNCETAIKVTSGNLTVIDSSESHGGIISVVGTKAFSGVGFNASTAVQVVGANATATIGEEGQTYDMFFRGHNKGYDQGQGLWCTNGGTATVHCGVFESVDGTATYKAGVCSDDSSNILFLGGRTQNIKGNITCESGKTMIPDKDGYFAACEVYEYDLAVGKAHITAANGKTYTISQTPAETATVNDINVIVKAGVEATLVLNGINTTGGTDVIIAEGGKLTIELDGENTSTISKGVGGTLEITDKNGVAGSLTAIRTDGYSAAIGAEQPDAATNNIIISGGTIVATSMGYGAAIGAASYSGTDGTADNIQIIGGDVTATSSYGAAIGAASGFTASNIVIKDATVVANTGTYGQPVGSGHEAASSTNISIQCGTYNMELPAAYFAEGYEPTKNDDGTWTVNEKTATPVAKIGNEEYTTLQAAVDAAQDGNTIELLSDVTVTEAVTIPAGKTLTLDFAGKTITANIEVDDDAGPIPGVVTNQGTLTLKDSSGDGGINGGSNMAYAVLNQAALVIEGGTYVGGAYLHEFGFTVWNKAINNNHELSKDSTVLVKNGYFRNQGNQPAVSGDGTTVQGGTFSYDPSTYVAAGYEAVANENGTWTVSEEATPVAQIGDVQYATLQAAVGAAKANDTIKLLDNITLDEVLMITDKQVTLDANGKTVTMTEEGIIRVNGSSDVTVTGNGKFVATANKLGHCFLVYGGSAVLTLENGDYEAVMTVAQAGNSSGKGTLYVKGGTYKTTEKYDEHYWILNKKDGTNSVIEVSGGTFHDFDPSGAYTESPNDDFCADGYEAKLVAGATNVYTVEKTATYVAQIGEDDNAVKYPTLAAAIAAVPDGTETTTTITMIGDETITTNAGVTIGANKNVILDLNGYTIDGPAPEAKTSYIIRIVNGGILTVKDGSQNGTGRITAKATGDVNKLYGNYAIDNQGGKFTLESGTIESDDSGTTVTKTGLYWAISTGSYATNAETIVNGGTVIGHSYQAMRVYVQAGGSSKLTINGGEIRSETKSPISIQLCDKNSSKFELTITGGTIISDAAKSPIYAWGYASAETIDLSDSKLSVTGGQFSCGDTEMGVVDWSSSEFKDCDFVNTPVQSVSGGIFSFEPSADQIVNGKEAVANNDTKTKDDYPWVVAEKAVTYVAQIGTTQYTSLADAIAEVQQNDTIEILCDITDAVGMTINTGKTFTIDFGGHTYTVSKPGAGSTGTETAAFQLIKDQTVTFKNGTITVGKDNLEPAVAPAKNIKRLFQSYANLTLKNMTIDGTNVYGDNSLIEFASGNVDITGNTSITARDGVKAINVDTWKGSYPVGAQVTIDTTGTIGDIYLWSEGTGDANPYSSLTIKSGTFGTLTTDGSNAYSASITGGTFAADPTSTNYIATGYIAKQDGERYKIVASAQVDVGEEEVKNRAATLDIDYAVDKEELNKVVSGENAAEVKAAITQNTKVTGVKLVTTGIEATGLQAVVNAAKEANEEQKEALETATNVDVEITVQAIPTVFAPKAEETAEQKVTFKLTPVATVTATKTEGNVTTEVFKQENVPVTNDMIDQQQNITVELYVGDDKPLQLIHTEDDNGAIIDTFDDGEFTYENGVASVTIHHFSEVTALFGAPAKPVAVNVNTDKTYTTLAAALKDATENQTVKLLEDIVGVEYVNVKDSRTLDLDGHSITEAELINSNGTIKDSGDDKGYIRAESYVISNLTADYLDPETYDDAWLAAYDNDVNGYRFYNTIVAAFEDYATKADKKAGKISNLFKFSMYSERDKLANVLKSAYHDYGRVTAGVEFSWDNQNLTDDHNATFIREGAYLNYMNSNQDGALKVTFTGTSGLENLKVRPWFAVLKENGEIIYKVYGNWWSTLYVEN